MALRTQNVSYDFHSRIMLQEGVHRRKEKDLAYSIEILKSHPEPDNILDEHKLHVKATADVVTEVSETGTQKDDQAQGANQTATNEESGNENSNNNSKFVAESGLANEGISV